MVMYLKGQKNDSLISDRKSVFIFFYYLLLIIVYVLMSKPEVQYGNAIRIVFFIITLIPAIKNTNYFVFAIICFYSMTYVAFTPILPTSLLFHLPVILFFYFSYYRYKKKNISQIILLFVFSLICIIHVDYQDFILVVV